MKKLTEFLLSYIVEKLDDVEVTEETNDFGSIVVKIKVAQEDMGKVIGKGGKIIRAIRDTVKILAVKENKHVDVVLVE